MKNTKISLWTSILAIILCFSLLLGSSFAWFTDKASSANNKIQAGNLKIDLELLDKATGEWKSLKDSQAPIFNYDKWEPGFTDTKILKVKNKGTLALKWVAKFYSSQMLSALADVIDVYVCPSAAELSYPTDINLPGYTRVGTLRHFVNTIEETNSGVLEAGEFACLGIAFKMSPLAGNEYQGLSLGGSFDIRIHATQWTGANEFDSFGNTFDKNATFDDYSDLSIIATETKTLVSGDDSINFNLVNGTLNIAKVSVPATAIVDPTQPVTVTFGGIEPSITGENIQAYAYDIKVTNLKSNLTEGQLVTVVVEAPNALAAMQAYHNGVLIEDAVYDEVAGTITFKTASFSPYEFTSNVEEVSDLAGLREVLQKDGYTAKLVENITVDLTKDSAARDDKHVLVSGSKKTYYNAVNILGKNVGLDLNGHNITAFCGTAYNSNDDVGALFFVGENGSLNITNTGSVNTGYIKMQNSIYAVWAPFADPSYVDIYGGAFIADSYAGDPIHVADTDTTDDKMTNENSCRTLIYAGIGGNMNVYGGYFLYNNTPNDDLNRNNGAFNAKDFYEEGPLLTIHDGVMLINKEYRQNPANTSTPNGSFDNYSVVLAKDRDIINVPKTITIDNTRYSSWYEVVTKLSSINAKAKKNLYNTGYQFTEDDFNVFAISENGTNGKVTNFTVSVENGIATIEYKTPSGETLFTTCEAPTMNLTLLDEDRRAEPVNSVPRYDPAGFGVSGWAHFVNGSFTYEYFAGGGTNCDTAGTYLAPGGEIVTDFNANINANDLYDEGYGNLTITGAHPSTTLGINSVVGCLENAPQLKGFGVYINNDVSTLMWNTPAITYVNDPALDGVWYDGGYYSYNEGMYNHYGKSNGHSVLEINCSTFKPGRTYEVHWVLVFEDGLASLCDWTVTMADASSSDAVFEDTELPNANVIIMAGQSNMFGPTPLTQDVIGKYAGVDYKNVFIKYSNINFNVDANGKPLSTMSTVFSNNDFEKYRVGIGAQGSTYFGPELLLAHSLATDSSFKDQQWFIIKYAPAGTALGSQWTNKCVLDGKETTLTDDMISYVKEAIDSLSKDYDVHVRSFMWMQGESDAASKNSAENYAGAEKALVSRVREEFSAYATRSANGIRVPGSGIIFINAGIASNDVGLTSAQGGPNDWIYAAEVNAGKISNSQWLCSVLGAETNDPLDKGPLKGYTFGVGRPSITNPDQSNVIPYSIYIDTYHFLSKAAAYENGLEDYGNASDNADKAHYSVSSMLALGEFYASCLKFMEQQHDVVLVTPKTEYKVAYDANGGSVTPESEMVEAGDFVTLPTPTRDGYTFTGWSDGTTTYAAGANYTVDANVTLTAQWERIQYIVTYDANGGSVTTSSATANAGDSVNLPTPTRNNYTFNGWYTAASGGTKVGDAGASYTPTADITLYAQWERIQYIVTYDANGGSVTTSSATVNAGDSVNLPTPTRNNYTFNGWYTAASGGTKVGDAGARYTPTADITLYAQWERIQYIVTYNANGGSVTPGSVTVPAGETVTLPTLTRDGYTLSGWYTAASGGTKVGNGGASYTPTASITLYAQWTDNGCFTPDTLITLADGTQKRIDQLTYDDEILVWDFSTGTYDVRSAAAIICHGERVYKVISLEFSDGTVVKIIDQHGFFDVGQNKFVFISDDNVESYIGHTFAKYDEDNCVAVQLVGYTVSEELTSAYSVLTYGCENSFAAGMLSITPFPGVDNEAFYGCLVIGENMTYDKQSIQSYIDKHGLYTYEELAVYGVSYEQFVGANLAYLKVIVGEGIVTLEEALSILSEYVPQ